MSATEAERRSVLAGAATAFILLVCVAAPLALGGALGAGAFGDSRGILVEVALIGTVAGLWGWRRARRRSH